MHTEERQLRERGYRFIAGVDEAGRGPLAGPVVAAAVMLPPDYDHPKIRDSKTLSMLEREQLFADIKNTAISYAVGIISGKQIDDMGILKASKLAMRHAVLKLNPNPEFILIDAVSINTPGIAQKAVIKGDATIFSVAAASIIAKVTRDRLMADYHKKYPEYGFNQHMGYGTQIHLEAIRRYGACKIHRLSFAPFK